MSPRLHGIALDQVTALIVDGAALRIERGTLGITQDGGTWFAEADRHIGVDEKRAAKERGKLKATSTRLRVLLAHVVGVEWLEVES